MPVSAVEMNLKCRRIYEIDQSEKIHSGRVNKWV